MFPVEAESARGPNASGLVALCSNPAKPPGEPGFAVEPTQGAIGDHPLRSLLRVKSLAVPAEPG
eukprot:11182361-Lingulodinium_polyedra.AAC.1